MNKTFALSDINSMDLWPVDLFISFCSFDERCLSIVKRISKGHIKKSIIYVNKKADKETQLNKDSINTLFGDRVDFRSIDVFDPIEVADSFVETINRECSNVCDPNILIDITSFTHEALLMFIAIADKLFYHFNIHYIYTAASSYASEKDDGSDCWLSRGIEEVRSVLGYPGDINPSRDTVLIVMMGYECERAIKVIDTIAPEELIITNNDEDGSTDQTNANASSVYADLFNSFAAYYPEPQRYIVSSNDPFKTAEQLEKVINTVDKEKNIIVAPMNNKLSTVGAAIVGLQMPRIQICYAPATYYNTSSYCVEGDTGYLFSLDYCHSK